jgi:hypothetical protein
MYMEVAGHHQFQNIDSSEDIKDKHLTPLIGFFLHKLTVTRLVGKFRAPYNPKFL